MQNQNDFESIWIAFCSFFDFTQLRIKANELLVQHTVSEMIKQDKFFEQVFNGISKGFKHINKESQMMIPSYLVYVRDLSRALFRENQSKFQILVEDISLIHVYKIFQ